MSNLLDQINAPNDIKNINRSDYPLLAKEIRRFLVDHVSLTGGHLASNLGTVDLTIALHAVLDLPEDKIVWDVGHQSYTHKILTGRKECFDVLRKYNGLSGFPKRNESECDVFGTGHSSTSISAALGIAVAKKLDSSDSTVVCVIGDGALTGGLAYEALNNLSSLKRNFIIILNDNNMSIAENVGGMSEYLNKIRVGEKYNDFKYDIEKSLNKIPKFGEKILKGMKRTKDSIKQLFIPGGIFSELGITYIGPVDGHDIATMISLFEKAKKLDHPVLIHVLTQKGKGYRFARENPQKFHGIEPFDKETGEKKEPQNKETYTDVFSGKIVEMGKEDEDIVAITAAMPDGCGLSGFAEAFPERFFDVGIAEEHAVTFAAGLAASGKKPFVSIYSSFSQRAYDQILHDVCIQNLPVRLILDRAGISGRDGETHQGVFDISFLSAIPNMTIIAPMNRKELIDSLDFAKDFNAPVAVRFPKSEAVTDDFDFSDAAGGGGVTDFCEPFLPGRSVILRRGFKIAVLAVGGMVAEAAKAVRLLAGEGLDPTLVNARFLKPLDTDMIDGLVRDHKYIFTVEEGILRGGYGEAVSSYICERDIPVHIRNFGIDDCFVKQGSVPHLRKKLGLDAENIAKRILACLESTKSDFAAK